MKPLLPLIFSICFSLEAGSQTINALLLDSASREIIPFAHIWAAKSRIGTISNENGAFELPIDVRPDTLVISHIAYKTRKIPFPQTVTDTLARIYMVPESILLDEIVVSDVETMEVVNDVLDLLKSSSVQFGKAFYRQIAFKDTIATEWIEAFYNVEHSINGTSKIKIDQARFAHIKYDTANLFLDFTNFSYITVANNIYAPERKADSLPRLGMPFALDFIGGYDFYVKEQYSKRSDAYFVIAFEPNDQMENPVNSYGYFIYNKSGNRLIQYTAMIDHDMGFSDIKYDGDKKIEIRHPKYTYQFNFSERTGNIDYLTVNFTYDFVQDEVVYPSRVSSKFIIYQLLDKKPRKLREPGIELEDVSRFENARYKPKFWRNNPVIKLTPEEEAIIATFEKENAFGTYFKGN